MRESVLYSNLKKLVSSREYIFLTLLVFFLSYGYFFGHSAIGVDDLCMDRYLDEYYLLHQGRLFFWLFTRLGLWKGNEEYSFWTADVVGMLTILVASILVAAILLVILSDLGYDNKVAIRTCTIFSCFQISYPLMFEACIFSGLAKAIGMGEICCAIAWYILYNKVNDSKKYKFREFIFSSVLIMIACSTYEAVVPVYLTLFFIYLILRLQDSPNLKVTAYQCVAFAIPLGMGFILNIVLKQITKIFLPTNMVVCLVAANHLGEGYTQPDALISLFEKYIVKYGIMGIWYFPITVLVVCILILAILWVCDVVKQRKFLLVSFVYLGMIFSLLFLSMIMGDCAPYRTCTNFAMFVGFVFGLLYLRTYKNSSKWIWMYLFMIIVLINQINDINYWFELDYRRWEQEENTIEKVGSYICANNLEKPIVFVGAYELSEEIYERIRIPQSAFDRINKSYEDWTDRSLLKNRKKAEGISSVIDWGINAFGEVNTELIKLFKYSGYDVKQGTEEMYREAEQNTGDMESWPNKGCIKDMGSYYIFKW